MLQFYTLGGFALKRDGHTVPRTAWGTHRAVILCKVLLTYHGQALHKEQIQDWVWPEASMEAGARNLRVALSELRRVLEPDRNPREPSAYIETHGNTIQLSGAGIWTDSWDLLQVADIVPTHHTAIPRLQAAAELYGGSYLPDELYADWSQAERRRLALAYDTVRLKLAQAYVVHHRHAEAIRVCHQALVDQPGHEGFVEFLMRCAVHLHQPGLALDAYSQLSRVLEADLGTEPSPHLADLAQQIRDGTLTGDAAVVLPHAAASMLAGTNPPGRRLIHEDQQLHHTLQRSTQLVDDLRDALERVRQSRIRLAISAAEAQATRARQGAPV